MSILQISCYSDTNRPGYTQAIKKTDENPFYKKSKQNALLAEVKNLPLPNDLMEQLIGIHKYVNQVAARGYDDRTQQIDTRKPGNFFTLKANYDQLRGHFGRLLIYTRELITAYNGYYEPETGLRITADKNIVPLEYAFRIAGNGLTDIGTSYHNGYVIDNGRHRIIDLHNHEKTDNRDHSRSLPSYLEKNNDINKIRFWGLPRKYSLYTQANKKHYLQEQYYSPILINIFDHNTLAGLSRDQYKAFLKYYLMHRCLEFRKDNNLYDLKGKQISANLDDYFNPQKALRKVYTNFIRQTFQTARAYKFFMDKGLLKDKKVEHPEIILNKENIIPVSDIDKDNLAISRELNEVLTMVKQNPFLLDFVIRQLDYAYNTAGNPEFEDSGIQEFVKDIQKYFGNTCTGK
ncbi:hypothetical protein ACFL57_02290 [Candidatus Margulisiibacteriota bacterium]